MIDPVEKGKEASPAGADRCGPAVSVRGLAKAFGLFKRPEDLLRSKVENAFRSFSPGAPPRRPEEFWALRDINFDLVRGEVLGVIGRNGSGKTTLLQLIGGLLAPTEGQVCARGRTAVLLELGAGFHPEFSGRENVYVSGAVLGIGRSEMKARIREVADFAEIGDFFDRPVKTYSNGMFLRLAFAVQACLRPDVLLVDEVLAVGDIYFQQKCHRRMEELMKQGTTVILVSHNLPMIEKYSTRALLLDQGRQVYLGNHHVAIWHYQDICGMAEGRARNRPRIARARSGGAGGAGPGGLSLPDWPEDSAFRKADEVEIEETESRARFLGLAICDDEGRPCVSFESGDWARFYFAIEAIRDFDVPVGGVMLTSGLNVNVHGKNNLQYFLNAPPRIKAGTRVLFRQRIQLLMEPSEYSVSLGFASMPAEDYARIRDMSAGEMLSRQRIIMRVWRAGTLAVAERSQGLGCPFYGLVDLPGDFMMEVEEKGEEA